MRHVVDHGLGVVGGELVAHGLLVEAAGHEGDAVGIARQLQGEGFGDGDRREQVLDAEEGALAAARGRHLEEDGWLRFGPAGEQVKRIESHGVVPFPIGFPAPARRCGRLRETGATGSLTGGRGRSSVGNRGPMGNVLQGGTRTSPLARPAVAGADVMSWACTGKRGRLQKGNRGQKPSRYRGKRPLPDVFSKQFRSGAASTGN